MELSYIFSKNPLCTHRLLGITARDIVKLYPGSGITFDALVHQTEMMAVKAFPGKEPVHIYKAEW